MNADLLAAPPRWWTAARCATSSPDDFFSQSPARVRTAVQVCSGCPVRHECYTDARARGEEHGVWGGVAFHKVRGA